MQQKKNPTKPALKHKAKAIVKDHAKPSTWNKTDTRIMLSKLAKLEETEEEKINHAANFTFRYINTRMKSERLHDHRKLLDAITLLVNHITK